MTRETRATRGTPGAAVPPRAAREVVEAARREAAGPAATVGVVLVTRDRRERTLATLDRIAELPDRPPVVMVDNASCDGTSEAVARRHPGIEVIRLTRNAGAAARTAGVRALGTDVVAFCDDDSWWAPGALAVAAATFAAHPRLGLLGARILVGPAERLDPTCERMRRSPLPRAPGAAGPPLLGFVACGAIVRRSAFLEVGGFHPRFGIGAEETLLALDLAARGWELAYVEGVTAHHHPAGGDSRRGRSARELRNSIWTAWLRRRPAGALRCTAALAAGAVRERQPRALLEAAGGLRWTLRERRPVPPGVERAARLLER